MAEIVYYTIQEVCERLKLSRAQVSRFIAPGELQAARFGRARRISEQALREFCEGQEPTTSGSPGKRRQWLARLETLCAEIRTEAPDLDLRQCLLEAREELAE